MSRLYEINISWKLIEFKIVEKKVFFKNCEFSSENWSKLESSSEHKMEEYKCGHVSSEKFSMLLKFNKVINKMRSVSRIFHWTKEIFSRFVFID